MPALALSLLVGILLGYWVATPNIWVAAMLVTGLGAIVWWLGGKLPLVVLIGFGIASAASHDFRQKSLPAFLAPMDVIVSGVVSDFPSRHGRVTSFTLNLSKPLRVLYGLGRIRLNSYGLASAPQAGETWRYRVRLKPVHGHISPGAFDRALWLFRKRVHATGYVVESQINRRLAVAGKRQIVLRLRSYLQARIEALTGSTAATAVLVGITVGIRSGLSDSQWQLFRKTGTSHLMAISGLHVGMVAFLMWHVGLYTGRFLRAVRFGPAVIAVTGITMGYAMLAGWSIPTTRALLMIALVLVGKYQCRLYRPPEVLCFALGVVLLIDSLAILSAGFWLSFIAVALLFTVLGRAEAVAGSVVGTLWSPIARLLHAQWVLTLGLALPTAIIFSQVPLATPLANLIAVPLFSFVTVPAALFGLVFIELNEAMAGFFLQLATHTLDFLFWLLEWLAQIPVVNIFEHVQHPVGMGLLTVLIILLLLPFSMFSPIVSWSIVSRLLCMLMIAVLAWSQYPMQKPVDIHVLDVGQGLAVIVRADNRVLVFDTGPSWPGGDAGKSVLIPALRQLGISRIDVVVISHGDDDHQGGLQSLLGEFKPQKIISSSKALTADVAVSQCKRGQSWQWGNVVFEFVHPRDVRNWSENNASCVLQLTVDGYSVLLPGDIEAAAELVLSARQELRGAQLVIAPHHGSKTSSSRQFIDRLQPEQVIFSTGYLNRWGFPAGEVVQRWRKSRACLFNTAVSGTLLIKYREGLGFAPAESMAASLKRPWPLRLVLPGFCPELL
jgi:competence protein ComEC